MKVVVATWTACILLRFVALSVGLDLLVGRHFARVSSHAIGLAAHISAWAEGEPSDPHDQHQLRLLSALNMAAFGELRWADVVVCGTLWVGSVVDPVLPLVSQYQWAVRTLETEVVLGHVVGVLFPTPGTAVGSALRGARNFVAKVPLPFCALSLAMNRAQALGWTSVQWVVLAATWAHLAISRSCTSLT